MPTLPETVDLAPLWAFASVVISALVGMIVVRKAIKIINRS